MPVDLYTCFAVASCLLTLLLLHRMQCRGKALRPPGLHGLQLVLNAMYGWVISAPHSMLQIPKKGLLSNCLAPSTPLPVSATDRIGLYLERITRGRGEMNTKPRLPDSVAIQEKLPSVCTYSSRTSLTVTMRGTRKARDTPAPRREPQPTESRMIAGSMPSKNPAPRNAAIVTRKKLSQTSLHTH